MKNTAIVFTFLIIFYLNLFLLKSIGVSTLSSILYIISPILYFPTLIKADNRGEKNDELIASISWGIALIPTIVVIIMTIVFGFPPEGYTPMDMFH